MELVVGKRKSMGTREGRIVVITDLHGCYKEMRELLEKLSYDETIDTLLCLGDTIDRGPAIYEVFEYLRDLKERVGDRCILIRGNHEQMMLDALRGGAMAKKLWRINSGEKTKFSFVHHKHQVSEFKEWYEEMPFFYQNERFIAVHACLADENPLKNTKETMLWGRDTSYQGKLVLTGHTPYQQPLAICGEDVGIIQEGVWGKLPEKGIFALDTGCVFGNRLTGIAIENDRFYAASVESTVESRNIKRA